MICRARAGFPCTEYTYRQTVRAVSKLRENLLLWPTQSPGLCRSSADAELQNVSSLYLVLPMICLQHVVRPQPARLGCGRAGNYCETLGRSGGSRQVLEYLLGARPINPCCEYLSVLDLGEAQGQFPGSGKCGGRREEACIDFQQRSASIMYSNPIRRPAATRR